MEVGRHVHCPQLCGRAWGGEHGELRGELVQRGVRFLCEEMQRLQVCGGIFGDGGFGVEVDYVGWFCDV